LGWQEERGIGVWVAKEKATGAWIGRMGPIYPDDRP
jgi:hypothetical protein